jgi:DnaJ-class molecular chaperone
MTPEPLDRECDGVRMTKTQFEALPLCPRCEGSGGITWGDSDFYDLLVCPDCGGTGRKVAAK